MNVKAAQIRIIQIRHIHLNLYWQPLFRVHQAVQLDVCHGPDILGLLVGSAKQHGPPHPHPPFFFFFFFFFTFII